MINPDELRAAGTEAGDALCNLLCAAANEIDRLCAEMDEWQRAAQAVVDLFDPCEHKVDPGTLVLIARAAKQACRGVRTERDAAQAKLAEVREILRAGDIDDPSHDELCDIVYRAWLAAGGKEAP